ncbi:hypothetical protein HJFPF1_04646 [Paramyrothecium foliicola]|nr:hypothetical protein HJFPF1_04646 [Paramyrothecium foliicola]
MDDDDGNGLFNIEISDDEVDLDEKAARRTGQSEEQFQAVKQNYHAKVENGDIYKSITLPLPPDATKPHFQEIIHALDELYFFRRYQEAMDFIGKVLAGGDGGQLDAETRGLLSVYEAKCKRRIKNDASQ